MSLILKIVWLYKSYYKNLFELLEHNFELQNNFVFQLDS